METIKEIFRTPYGPLLGLLLVIVGHMVIRLGLGHRELRDLLPSRSLWVGVIVAYALVQVGVLVWNPLKDYRQSFKKDQIGILVAKIPGDENNKQQNTYIAGIRELLFATPDLMNVVKIRGLEKELPPGNPDEEHREAKEIGRRLRATFVLRPMPTEVGHSVWLTIIDRSDFPREDVALGTVSHKQLKEPEQLQLPGDMVLLARCVLGISFHAKDDYHNAAKQFSMVLGAEHLPPGHPSVPAMHFLLGNSFHNMAATNPPRLLPLAINSYDAALRLWTRERDSENWAMVMNNRGTAFEELPGPNRETNVRQAVSSYDAALEVYTGERFPYEWGMTMNNRGNAYQELPGPDREANLHQAIRDYDAALEVRIRKRFPVEWAITTHNRGNAHRKLPASNRFERERNLREAIRCYDGALEVFTRKRFPADWAMTMNNRGIAFTELAAFDQQERNARLREAIRCFEGALEVYSRRSFPFDWAMTMNNLGTAHLNLSGPDTAANLRKALAHFDGALGVLTVGEYPIEWAGVMVNRGIVFEGLPASNRLEREKNLREAIRCYKLGLKVLQEQGFEDDAEGTRRNLERTQRLLNQL